MTTVTQLIEYLQTLPGETVVKVAENVDQGNYASYVSMRDLQLPTEFCRHLSDNLEFYADEETPELELGSR